MKKTITLLMTIALTLALCCGAFAENYSVGVCQLMVHDSLDQATQVDPRVQGIPSTKGAL